MATTQTEAIEPMTSRELRKLLEVSGEGGALTIPLEIAERVLTEERRRILDVLVEHDGEVDSLVELSRELDREPANVSRSLDELVELNIIHREEDGKKTRIRLVHDHVLIEPIY